MAFARFIMYRLHLGTQNRKRGTYFLILVSMMVLSILRLENTGLIWSHLENYSEDTTSFHRLQEFSETITSKILPSISIFSKKNTSTTKVAIACATTSKGMEKFDIYGHHIVKDFLPTFCETASQGYIYTFYISADKDDRVWDSFPQIFMKLVQEKCKKKNIIVANVKLVRCKHNKKPAWAQNDAMMEAYMDGMDYGYRINDDTVLDTPGWTEKFISALLSLDPPNIGVVGPIHINININYQNNEILTYDFTNFLHIDIFGFHYPKYFIDWSADDWITRVYKPNRSIKEKTVRLSHLVQKTRYKAHPVKEVLLRKRLKHDIEVLNTYLSRYKLQTDKKDDTNGIGIALWKDDIDFVYGALRNVQLANVWFPKWKVRVYIPFNIPTTGKELFVKQNVIEKIESLGANIKHVDLKETQIPAHLIGHLIIDDADVENFIIRDPRHRLGECDVYQMDRFIHSNNSIQFFEYKNHLDDYIIDPEMLNGKRGGLIDKLFRNSVRNFIQENIKSKDELSQTKEFYNAIRDKTGRDSYTHRIQFIPQFQTKSQPRSIENECLHLGQKFDYYGEPFTVV